MRQGGDAEGALPFAREAVDIYDTLESPSAMEHAHAFKVLGGVLRALGRNDDALPTFEASVRITRRLCIGESGPITTCWLFYRGVHADYLAALQLAGRMQDATALQRQFVDDCRRVVPPDGTVLANALANLGTDLVKQGAYIESQAFLRECIALREEAIRADSPRLWLLHSIRGVLGEALSREGASLIERDPTAAAADFEEAEALLIGATQWMIDNPERIPAAYRTDRTRLGMERIISLYKAWDTLAPDAGKAEQAARWQVELDKLPRP
jgi:tetratricopeptide (TPR) repeat protein